VSRWTTASTSTNARGEIAIVGAAFAFTGDGLAGNDGGRCFNDDDGRGGGTISFGGGSEISDFSSKP
jgi:hypothetical protein